MSTSSSDFRFFKLYTKIQSRRKIQQDATA